MSRQKTAVINVEGSSISIYKIQKEDYISLTDIAKKFGGEDLIYNWIRNRNTIELLGVWETLYNPNFKGVEFDTFKMSAGLNNFRLSPKKWVNATGAIGIRSRSGRYGGGTYAHKDLAFEFGSWLSPAFKLYLIKEFQNLKKEQAKRSSMEWNLHRTLSKINYKIHTDAIKKIIPPNIRIENVSHIYAGEADILNVAMFGMTAADWRGFNKEKEGNIRDYSTIEQLLVLANLESLNATFIQMGFSKEERLIKLNLIAIDQIKSLIENKTLKKLVK